MKNWVIILISLLFTMNGWSQSISGSRELTIQNSFETAAVEVYALQAQSKVEELFEYLRLASDKNNSTELNEQIQNNIVQLFVDQPQQLMGIGSKDHTRNIKQWANEWKQAEIEELQLTDSRLYKTHWVYKYKLIYLTDGKKISKKMDVQVYFQPQTKTFGSTRKQVWELKIGNVILR